MFEDLARAIEAVNTGADGRAIAALLGLKDRLLARIADAVGEFHTVGMAELDGATSTTAWLRNANRMTGADAHRLSLVARFLVPLPTLAAALRDGAVSWGQVEVLVRTLGLGLLDAFIPMEAEVAGWLAPMDMEATVVLVTRIKALLEGSPEPDPEADRLHFSTTFGGRGVGDFELGPESSAILAAALAAAMSPDVEGEPTRSPAEKRANALIDMAQSFLDQGDDGPERRHRPHVNLVVETSASGQLTGHVLEGSDVLARSSVLAFLCDCSISRVMRQGSTILDYGTATRTIPRPLWNALVVRDTHCRFPGCDRPARWCDGHHVTWFSNHGPTCLDNLVLMCRRHHRLLHRGWEARIEPDGTLEVTDPQGVLRVSHPPRWQSTLVPA